MLAWAAQRPVVCHPDLVAVLRDGFGPANDGVDPFDAVVGLFLMLGCRPRLPAGWGSR